MEKKFAVEILNADNTREGLAIAFSDGTTTLFDPEVLYSVRLHEKNRQMNDESEEGEILEGRP